MVKQAYPSTEQQKQNLDFPCHEKVSKEDNPQGRVCRAKNLVDNELKKNKGWHFLKGEASIVIIPSTVKVQWFDVKPQEDGTIKAEWTISGKVEKDFSFKIEHQFNRRASRDQKFENVLPTEVGPEKRDALLGPFGADFDGYHRLKLKVLDNIKNVVAESPTRLVGLYSDEYIELYNGEADDCKKHRIKTNGDEECDVVGNKRDSIRKNEHAKKAYDADQKLRNELEFLGCMPNHFKTLYEKGNNDGAVCRPQAVQALFTAAVKQYYTSEKQQKEFLTLQCRAENNPLGQVCRARQNLDKTLEKLEWAKVTTRKEDAQGRVAPGLPAPPQQPPPVQELRPKTQTKITTVPEKPLPGELFKLVVTAESANPVKWLRMTTNLKADLKSTKWNEWNILPCDWVSKSCKREWTGLYFDPKPTGIRVSLIDALDTYSEITPPGGFIPTVSDNCLENHNAGEKWAGCRNENNEVLYECGADGKTKLIPADRPMSFLCRGGSLIGPFIDYGGTDAVGQGDSSIRAGSMWSAGLLAAQ